MNEARKEVQITDETVAENTTGDTCDLKELLVQPVGKANHWLQDTNTNDGTGIPVFLGVIIGAVVSVTHNNGAKSIFVDYPGNPGSSPIPARTIVDIHADQVDQEVTLMFDGGNPFSPIIMGVLQKQESLPKKPTVDNNPQVGGMDQENINVELDGETLTIKAKDQIKLECGKASITLTKAGKILLRGEYVMSRSTGVNSIKGGSVQLN